MKVIIAAMAATAVLAGGAAPAGAQSYSGAYEIKQHYVKKKKKRYRYYRRQYWADKLPYGTQIWWEQMDREGRGGRRR